MADVDDNMDASAPGPDDGDHAPGPDVGEDAPDLQDPTPWR